MVSVGMLRLTDEITHTVRPAGNSEASKVRPPALMVVRRRRANVRRIGWARDAVELPRIRCGGCSTIELGRHIEPATGVEPITCDNPQLRPIKSVGGRSKMRARSDLDSTVALPVELLASKREDGFEPPTYSVR